MKKWTLVEFLEQLNKPIQKTDSGQVLITFSHERIWFDAYLTGELYLIIVENNYYKLNACVKLNLGWKIGKNLG